MKRKTGLRRLLVTGMLVGALVAAAPASSIAANGGGGPGPTLNQIR